MNIVCHTKNRPPHHGNGSIQQLSWSIYRFIVLNSDCPVCKMSDIREFAKAMKEDHIPKADTVYVAIKSQLVPTSRITQVISTHQVSYIAMAFEFFTSIVSHFIFCRRGRDFFNSHSLADDPGISATNTTRRDTDCSKPWQFPAKSRGPVVVGWTEWFLLADCTV